MAAVNEIDVLLTYDELRILLFSIGCTECEGVFMPRKEFSQEEVLKAMHTMSGRGILIADNDVFIIREDIREMLEVISRPAATEELDTGYGNQMYFVYICPDRIVVSEKYWMKKDTVRLRMYNAEDYREWRRSLYDNR